MDGNIDYRDCDEALGRVDYPEPFAQLVIAQARLARRELRILSPRLDHRVFHDEALFSAIRGLLRRAGRQARVCILLQDLAHIVRQGHGLVELGKRLPTGIELRHLPEHPEWDGDTLVLRDRDSVLSQPAGERTTGFYRPGDRARCETALTRFDSLWRSGRIAPELRALSL